MVNTGSYWGGGGEQIDTLSGNLHFSVPLLTAQGRAGWKAPVSLVYDSQNWRQDQGVNWQLGNDVGFGFGWKMLIGSITPYYTQYYGGVDHYVYTDSTGAEYRLDVNTSGVWSSTHSNYVWFDGNANILHFKDGKFWIMGCTSGGLESDAGTLYPTIIEDQSGNQVIIAYDTGAGLPFSPPWSILTPNTSARITSITDVRGLCGGTLWACYTYAGYDSGKPVTYTFNYDRTTYAAPHISSISNVIGTAENYTFHFSTSTLNPPFGSDATYANTALVELTGINPGWMPYSFAYDGAGTGEFTQVTFPFGGHLRWTYLTDLYAGNRALRAVASRYLAADSSGATEWSYTLTRDSAASATTHSTFTLVDASGVGAKTWKFNGMGAPAWQTGLVSEFIQSASAGGTVYTDDTYTWSQDPAGNPYISAKISITDPGTGHQQTARTTQTLDQYGNVTQSVIYPLNDTTTPLRTYTNTYLNSAGYIGYYVRDRLATSTLTTAGTTKVLVQNYYDGAYLDNLSSSPSPLEWVTPPVPASYRGYVATSVTPEKTTNYGYLFGAMAGFGSSDGSALVSQPSSATNYGAPQSITTQSYGQTLSYNPWLGITQATGLNGEQLAMSYDNYGRPITGTSPYGATWTYSYSDYSSPKTQACFSRRE